MGSNRRIEKVVPCFRYSPKPLGCGAGLDFACLHEITVEQVYDACVDLMGELV